MIEAGSLFLIVLLLLSNLFVETMSFDSINENSIVESKIILDSQVTSGDFKDLTSSDFEGKIFKFSNEPSLEEIRRLQKEFVDERKWSVFHTPRNLLLAMVGEVGELSELFQWRGEVKEGLPDWTEKDKEHLGQELSDVLLYLIRLSEVCHIDLPTAVLNKMTLNKEKYPIDKVKGSSKKYTEYE